jgi:hypothetical protein
LRVLRDHQHQFEVVHAKGDVVQLVDVGQEDDVLDGVFDNLGISSWETSVMLESKLVYSPLS